MIKLTLRGQSRYLLLLLPCIAVLILASIVYSAICAVNEFITVLTSEARDMRDIAKDWCRQPMQSNDGVED